MLKINGLISKTLITLLTGLSLLTTVESQAAGHCGEVWNGTIERARVQVQANGETWLLFYTYPGNNADYIGYVKSDLMANVLLRGKEKGESLTGYTDDSCKIKWADFR